MYGASGFDFDHSLTTLLSDLRFLDGLDDTTGRRAVLDFFGKRGVVGPFENNFGPGQYVDEIASVHAEAFHRAGYLRLGRTLSSGRYQALIESARDQFEDLDFRRSDVETLLGEPSFIVGLDVISYAPADGPGGWVHFDFDRTVQSSSHYDFGHGRFVVTDKKVDPILRDVRIPAANWEDGLVLTLFGKVKRWGPSWWIDRPSRRLSADQAEIAGMLRQIRDQDPSQAE